MSAQPAFQPTEQLNILPQLDLTSVTERVIEEYNLSPQQAALGEQWYRMFLSLHQSHTDTVIAPPALADKWWHEHITQTRKYFADCEALFGEYLHHNVDQDEVTAQRAKKNATELYQSEFGEDISNTLMANCNG